jgi:hypothetical protein
MSEARTEPVEVATLQAFVSARPQLLRNAWWVPAIMLMMGLLLAPALVNGFPLIFADTGGYLLRPIEGQLELGRSALYGVFLLAGRSFDFWPVVIAQAALTCWIILLTLRTFDLGERPGPAVVIVLILTFASSLPWYVGQLMPDIFVLLSALALYLLAYRSRQLHRLEMLGLAAVVAFAIASHMSILAMAVVILLGFAVLRCLPAALPIPRPELLASSTAVGGGIALALFSNLIIAGVFGFTPGGSNFLFARLVQDGIVARYLKDRCPDPEIRLCAFRRQIPTTTDDWLWAGDGPLSKLGGWEAFEPEANRIIRDTVRRYPYALVSTAVRNTLTQLVTLGTGEGVTADNNWHVEYVFREHAPHALARYRDSVQSRNALDFTAINALQVPAGLLATAALPVLLIMLLRRRRRAAAGLVLTAMIALLANAAICGAFSGAANRYQSRLVPAAILAVIIGGWVLSRREDPLRLPAGTSAP